MYEPKMVPLTMISALRHYIDYGSPKGHFLTAVLSNDLFGAAKRADNRNFEVLAHIVCWCYNNVPQPAWGSREKYNRWIKAHVHVRDNRGYAEMQYTVDEVLGEVERMEKEESRKAKEAGS